MSEQKPPALDWAWLAKKIPQTEWLRAEAERFKGKATLAAPKAKAA